MTGTNLTLNLVSEILQKVGMMTPTELIADYLAGKKGCGLEWLNWELEQYIANVLAKEIPTGARFVKLENTYLPLNAIKKWEIVNKYSYSSNSVKYNLVINSTDQRPSVYDNVIIEYASADKRQKDIEKLLEMKLSNSQL